MATKETLKTRGMVSPDEPAEPVATASMMLVPGEEMPRRPRDRTSGVSEVSIGPVSDLGED